jgi:isocitrate dehydrogenase
LAKELAAKEQTIVAELAAVQGVAVDIGGYYLPDLVKVDAVMRPSATLNEALKSVAV